jgi:hypothetical protein
MTTEQAATVIREAIREAAKEVGCKPSEAHDPPTANRAGIHARNLAIVAAFRQGVSKEQLAYAFRRIKGTIGNILLNHTKSHDNR